MRLVDWQIAVLQKQVPIIDPYEEALITEGLNGKVLPYGLAGDGYVLRLSPAAAVMHYRVSVDPKHLPKVSEVHRLNFIPQMSCLMGLTVETVHMPAGYVGRLELVDEYALAGLRLLAPEIPGEFEGRVVISVINPLVVPVWIYFGEGVAKLAIENTPPLESRKRAGRGRRLLHAGTV